MKKDKLVYEAPEAEIFEVRFAENMLTQASNYGTQGAAGGDLEGGNEYTL